MNTCLAFLFLQEKDRLITNLKTIEDYLCSFNSQVCWVLDHSKISFSGFTVLKLLICESGSDCCKYFGHHIPADTRFASQLSSSGKKKSAYSKLWKSKWSQQKETVTKIFVCVVAYWGRDSIIREWGAKVTHAEEVLRRLESSSLNASETI